MKQESKKVVGPSMKRRDPRTEQITKELSEDLSTNKHTQHQDDCARAERSAHVGPRNRVFSSLIFKMSLGLVLFIAAVVAASYFVTQTKGKQVISEQAEKLNREIGQNIVLKLQQRLVATETLTTTLAKLGVSLSKDVATFKDLLPKVIDQAGMSKLVAGGGVWPEPNQFKEGVERRSFFWGRNEQGVLEYFDDYNDPKGNGYHNEEWYVPARYLKHGRAYWSKSYMDPYSLEPMVTCTVPMFENGVFKGVATIDLRLTGLSEFMSEQAKLIGGYAFALDRNNRLLSFPVEVNKQAQFLDLKGFVKHEYPTMSDISATNSGFQQIESYLKTVSTSLSNGAGDDKFSAEVKRLAEVLAEESYQVEVEEGSTIAAFLLGLRFEASTNKPLILKDDPILLEASSIRVLSLPNIGWKVVLSMPARYSIAVVDEISDGLLSNLLVLLVFSALSYIIFFNLVFMEPINKLTQQVRKLVSREDYVTRLKIPSSSELSQLASWFNIRTSQLSETLDELKQRNSQLDDAREVAESANRSKNIFLASMSHDIRTPMNAIIGLSDVLKKTKLDAEQDKFVNVINSSAQALLSLINDIMDFSKIEANQLDLESIPFDLRQVVDDCADLINFQAQEKRLEFIYYLSPDINRWVKGDPNRIRQVILNLAANAVKFTSSGRVELWLESAYQNDNNTQLIVEVRDTGIGLSKTAQSKLFTPFVQGDSSTTGKYGGTGLGLTICKHLAELMGGSVDFRSEEGIGTTFIFKLKLQCQQDKNVVLHDAQRKTALPTKVLLLEGKDHFQNSVLEQYFRAAKIEFETFVSVSSWLSVLAKESPDSLVTVSVDSTLLYELESMESQLPDPLKNHKTVLMTDKDECSEIKDPSFSGRFRISFLSQPLRYDELLAEITCHDGSHEGDNIKLDNVQHGEDLGFAPHSKILVVEDNKVNQQVLMIMLDYLNLKADIANDGVEALEAVQKSHYDLILMDWQMPRMDGLEATRNIRAIQGLVQPAIIAVTANAMSGDIEKCIEAGMDDYLSKPVEKDKLEQAIRRWLAPKHDEQVS